MWSITDHLNQIISLFPKTFLHFSWSDGDKKKIEQKADHSLIIQLYLLGICHNQGNTRLQDEHKNEQDLVPVLKNFTFLERT